MGVGSLLCMYFILVEQVGLDQPQIHHLPGHGRPTQLTLGQLVCVALVAS